MASPCGLGGCGDGVGWPDQLLLWGSRSQSGSQLRGAWLKRNVQWVASAQEGLKKALPSPGLCVRVINCSSQLISLAGLSGIF